MVDIARTRRFSGVFRWLSLLALAGILSAGVLLAWWTAVRADSEMRAELLRQTRLVAQALNLDDIRALSATRADLDRAEYQRLKKQLATVRFVNRQCRFVYLMGNRANGEVFFLVDSEPPDSKDYSPPGQIYEEVTEEDRRLFATKTALVEGPVTDHWGVWVSSLVPLIDPQTGALIAVLGMDVDASTWQWAVAARVALPVGLILVLLIVAGVGLISARRVDSSPKPVLRRLLLPLAAMVVLLLVGAGALLWQQQRYQLRREIAADISDALGDLHVALDQEISFLAASAKPLAADPAVQKALRECDADRLLKDWGPLFETMRRENHLTHLSFFDQHRVCLLRIHKPDLRGDHIDRFTAREAERTGKTAAGLELGALDIYTLRVVQPVFADRQLVGFVELGQEIEDTLHTLHSRSGNQFAVVLHKEFLHRPAWEEGMRMLGRVPEWDRLSHNVLIYASQGRLPDAFAAWADQRSVASPSGELNRELAFDGKTWQMSSRPLYDTVGQAVGDLLVLRDITAEKAALGNLLILGGSAGAVLLTLLLGFIYVLLRRTNAGILAQQATLRESEERLQLALSGAGEGIIDWDLVTDRLRVTPELPAMLGYDLAEFPRTRPDFLALLHPGDRVAVEARFRDLQAGFISSIDIEERLRTKAGEWKWVLTRGKIASRDASGRPRQYLGTYVDIAKRKRAERALRASEHKYRTLVENMTEGALRQRADGAVVEVNHAALKMLKLTRKDVLGRTYEHLDWDLVREDGQPFPGGEYPHTLAFKTGKPVYGVVMGIRNSRLPQRIWLEISAIPEFHPGELLPYQIMLTLHDLTARKQAEEDQRESNLRFHQLVDNIHQVFWMADLNTQQVIYVSPAYEGIWGRTCESLYQDPQNWLAGIHPEDRGRVENLLDQQVSGGYHVEYRVVRPDGSLRWITDHAFPVCDAAGRVYRIAGVAEDITARIQAGQDLEDYQRKLRSLAHQLLLVEERARRKLASTLHDGPCQVLAVARMKLDELETSAAPDQLRPPLQEITALLGRSIQEMRSLMLDLSPPVLHELGLVAAARWLADDLQARYQLQVCVTDDGSPKPLAPQIADVLYRSLRELLINVVKHARTKTAQVTLRNEPAGLCVMVEDQGAGFETSPTLSSSDGIRKSSGFGLFSIHEWLSHLGGSLKVHSRPQKGTTVTIRLPAQVVNQEASKEFS